MSDKKTGTRREEGLGVKERQETRRPPLYRVILHNDDFTTMEFVVQVLMEVFHKSRTEATHLMFEVHMKGAGLCGVFTREIAETKVDQVTQLAREEEHPLLCTMEPETGGEEDA